MSDRQGIIVRKRKSRSRRAGLLFPVGTIHRLCRKGPWVGSRISAGAPVYLAAVMEYLTAELLEQAGLVARYGSSDKISPRHIRKAVKTDEELDKLCEGVVMRGGDDKEVDKGIASLRLLKADMAGDLRGPTHGSLVGKVPQNCIKEKTFKIPKIKAKDKDRKGPVTPRHEGDQVIDLDEKNSQEKRGNRCGGKDKMQKLNKDINGNNILVDLTKGDRPMSGGQYRHGQAEKKGSGGDNTERQVAMVSKALSGGKSSGKEGKPPSFEDEMIKADLRLDKIYKNKKKSKTNSSCQATSLRY